MKVTEVVESFLAVVKLSHKPKSYEIRSSFCRSFAKVNKALAVEALRRHHVTSWLAKYPNWGASTRRMAIVSVVRCFCWAKAEGYIDTQPLVYTKGEMPKARSRSRDDVPTREEFKCMMANADLAVKRLLFALNHTGARPGEVAMVEARHFSAESKAWVFDTVEGKTLNRTIPLTPKMVRLTRTLCKRYPTGPLFRTQKGKRWNKKSMSERLTKLKARCGITRKIAAYCVRHKFITDGLLAGVTSSQLAPVVGHKSSRMIDQVYGHVHVNDKQVRDALAKFRG